MAIVNAQVEAVQKLYVAYFNRPADAAGLDYWTNVVATANGDTSAASAAFAVSQEYTDTYKGLSSAATIDKVYMNLFGHHADTAGQKYWADLLDSKQVTIDSVVTAVAGGAQTTDAEAYDNKVAGATLFTKALDTAAEMAGYSGDDANALGKEFISSITTDATLAAATTPAALSASVSAAVIAGTPFTLASGFATLGAAQDAEAAFLKGLDLDNDPSTKTTATDVTNAQHDALDAVGDHITVTTKVAYLAATPGVQAALLQDQIAQNAQDLKDAQASLATDQKAVDKVTGLSTAIATLQAATDNADAADKAETDAAAAQASAEAFYNVKNHAATTVDNTVTINSDGTAGDVAHGALIAWNSDNTKLVLASGIKEADHPGITALLTAVTADQAALAAQTDAHTAQDQAQLDVSLLDVGTGDSAEISAIVGLLDTTKVGTIKGGVPTAAQIETQLAIDHDAADGTEATLQGAINDFMTAQTTNDPLSSAVMSDAADVKAASDAIDALTSKVADVNAAKVNADQLKALDDAITAAHDLFTAHDFNAPVALNATNVATAGSDLYTLPASSIAAATISSFGRIGDDALFIGTKYTLGADESKGDNATLEVFFKQDGANAKIYVETAAYGSDQASHAGEQTITLTGVNVADLHFNNGIITVS